MEESQIFSGKFPSTSFIALGPGSYGTREGIPIREKGKRDPSASIEYESDPAALGNEESGMTREEQEARNEATEARVERIVEEVRSENKEVISKLDHLGESIENQFRLQDKERESFRSEVRGNINEVKESNKWATRFVNLGIAVITALVAFLAFVLGNISNIW